MIVEVVAVGTELLLGQIVNTNAAWIGDRLAASGIDTHYQTVVGDNTGRISLALRSALARSDAVIACGGLGPTHDDLTRDAIAAVMNVPLDRDEEILADIARRFAAMGRRMAPSNARQADVPRGAAVIPQKAGTAPGLICPVGNRVVYAVPGVPSEMREMVERAVVPDLATRARERGEVAVIASRTLRTWGMSESGLADTLGEHIAALDTARAAATGSARGEGRGAAAVPTLAFLASGAEGLKVRITVKARDAATAQSVIAEEEALLREMLGESIFGADGETMEQVVASLLVSRALTLAVAESVTGGLVAARLVDVPGASSWFRGGVVSYASAVKHGILAVPDGPVVTPAAAVAMAQGVRRLLGADCGVGITGVAGPDRQEGQPPGTVHLGIAAPFLPGDGGEALSLRLPGDRAGMRQLTTITALDLLRRKLLRAGPDTP